MQQDKTASEQREWPLWAVILLMVMLAPFAMYAALRCLPIHWQPSATIPVAIFIATALLSITGVAVKRSSAGKVAVATFCVVVGGTTVVWLFTSSIGGQAPGPMGMVLGAIGSGAGWVACRLPRRQPLLAGISWGLVVLFAINGTFRALGEMKAKNMNQEVGSPRYVEMNVMPMLVDFRGPLNWHSSKFVPGHEDTGGTFEAEGTFSRGNVYIRAYDNQASYSIVLDTTSHFRRTPDEAVTTGLDRSRKWLKEQGVRADTLQDLAFTEKGWTATAPKEMKTVVIDQFENSVVIGGYVRLPTNN